MLTDIIIFIFGILTYSDIINSKIYLLNKNYREYTLNRRKAEIGEISNLTNSILYPDMVFRAMILPNREEVLDRLSSLYNMQSLTKFAKYKYNEKYQILCQLEQNTSPILIDLDILRDDMLESKYRIISDRYHIYLAKK